MSQSTFFDTHEFIKGAIDAGIDPSAAEYLARKASEALKTDLATKADLDALESQLRAEIVTAKFDPLKGNPRGARCPRRPCCRTGQTSLATRIDPPFTTAVEKAATITAGTEIVACAGSLQAHRGLPICHLSQVTLDHEEPKDPIGSPGRRATS